jgi:hypothetical protein
MHKERSERVDFKATEVQAQMLTQQTKSTTIYTGGTRAVQEAIREWL